MASKPERSASVPEPFKRFEALARRLLAVPKGDVDKKEQERPKRQRKQRDT